MDISKSEFIQFFICLEELYLEKFFNHFGRFDVVVSVSINIHSKTIFKGYYLSIFFVYLLWFYNLLF